MLALHSERVVLPAGVVPATILIDRGVITEVIEGPVPLGLVPTDLGTQVLSPGLVDSHVHVNEPGRTEWEGFTSATRAAAAGGVTTIVDMPLNSLPSVTNLAGVAAKRQAAAGQLWVDVALWGGITSADTSSIQALADAGVCGVKAFLCDSGVAEFGHLSEDALHAALLATRQAGLPLVVHAEWPAVLEAAPGVTGTSYASWVASRPPEAEVAAVRALLEATARTDAHAHVLHLSAAGVLPLLEEAQRGGVRLSAETCPHYLSLSADELPDGSTPAKCAPPVRGGDNREQLWDGVRAGMISAVVSDHSPSTAELKQVASGDMALAWGGVSGLQTQLPVVWTAARSRGVGLAELGRLQSLRPAALAGLSRKGAIAVGLDADLVAWDPEATFTVDPAALLHKNPLSPWAGHELFGVVRTTWLRGVPVDIDGAPTGRLLERTP